MPTPTPTPIPFFSGLFEIDAVSNTDFPVFRLQGNLTQNGNSMSGIMHLAMLSCVLFNTDIQVTGTLSNPDGLRLDLAMVLPGHLQARPVGHLARLCRWKLKLTG